MPGEEFASPLVVKPLSSYQKSLDEINAELGQAHYLSDLTFVESDGIIIAKRRYGTTISVLGYVWSWITSFFYSDNKQNLRTFYTQQSQAFESEFSQFISDPTIEKVRTLVRHHEVFSSCFQTAQQMAGASPISNEPPRSLQNRLIKEINALYQEDLAPKERLEGWTKPVQPQTHSKQQQLQRVINILNEPEFKAAFSETIERFTNLSTNFSVKETVFEASQSKMVSIDEKFEGEPGALQRLTNHIQRWPESARKDSLTQDEVQLDDWTKEALKIQDLDKAFPDIYQIYLRQINRLCRLQGDILRFIIEMLPIKDRVTLGRTCKGMNQVVHQCDPDHLREQYIERFMTHTPENREKILDHLCNTKPLKVSQKLFQELLENHLKNLLFTQAIPHLQKWLLTGHLKSLCFPNLFYDSRACQAQIAFIHQLRDMPEIVNLRHLTLGSIPLDNQNVARAIQQLVAKTRHLTSLNFIFVANYTYQITHILEDYLPGSLSSSTALESAEIVSCNLTSNGLKRLPPTLRRLHLVTANVPEQDCLDALEYFEKIETLSLHLNLPVNGLQLKLPPYVQSLTIKARGELVHIDSNQLSTLKSHEHLRHLHLINFWPCTDVEIAQILPLKLQSLKMSLQEGDFYYNNFSNTLSDAFFTQLGPLSALESLEIVGHFGYIYGETIDQIPVTVKTVKMDRSRFTAAGMRAFMLRYPSEFRHSRFTGDLESEDADTSFLEGVPDCIETLELSLMASHSHFGALSSQTHLRELNFLFNHGGPNPEEKPTLEQLRRLPQSLRSFSYSNNVATSSRFPLEGISYLNQLEKLKVSGSIDPTNAIFPTSLQSLALFPREQGSNNIYYTHFMIMEGGDLLMEKLIGLPHLNEFVLHDESVTGQTFHHLPTQLRRLLLPISTKVTDEAIAGLKHIQLTRLEIGSLNAPNECIRGATLEQLPSTLQTVSLYCSALNPEMLPGLGHLLHLQELSLGNLEITSPEQLSQFSTTLESLNLSYCSLKINSLQVLQRYPRLAKLHLDISPGNCLLQSLGQLPPTITTLNLKVHKKYFHTLPKDELEALMKLIKSLSLPNLKKFLFIGSRYLNSNNITFLRFMYQFIEFVDPL